jgi:hypothetical protein
MHATPGEAVAAKCSGTHRVVCHCFFACQRSTHSLPSSRSAALRHPIARLRLLGLPLGRMGGCQVRKVLRTPSREDGECGTRPASIPVGGRLVDHLAVLSVCAQPALRRCIRTEVGLESVTKDHRSNRDQAVANREFHTFDNLAQHRCVAHGSPRQQEEVAQLQHVFRSCAPSTARQNITKVGPPRCRRLSRSLVGQVRQRSISPA